jgi:predicted nucleotide-binding protein
VLRTIDYPLISVQASPKYHVYVEYAEPDKSGIRFNVSQEELVRTFTSPFDEGKPFWFMGKLLNSHKVVKAAIFWSYQTADKLTLPNKENLVSAKDKKYVLDSIVKGKVKGAYLCTEKFLPPTQKPEIPAQSEESSSVVRRRVLVVCGTDDEMKRAVTNALTKLQLVPVVMCEEPSQGRKIVEHFSDYVDVGFAVVLLSPDESLYDKDELPTKRKLRPLQDVVFELGFLLGKLGKGNVLVFQRECGNFESPTNFEGLKVTAFDDRDSWKLALVRELTNSRYTVDAGRILQ